jgi:hypothetical protein
LIGYQYRYFVPGLLMAINYNHFVRFCVAMTNHMRGLHEKFKAEYDRGQHCVSAVHIGAARLIAGCLCVQPAVLSTSGDTRRLWMRASRFCWTS